jgi:hypothetical protein
VGEGDARVEAPHGPDLQHEPARADVVTQRQALGRGHAQRLLDQDVLAGSDGLPRGGDVVLVRRRHDDRVELGVGQHGRVVREGPGRVVDRAHLRDEVLGQIADRVQLGVARLVQRLEVGGLRDRAGAEDADAELGSLHAGVR